MGRVTSRSLIAAIAALLLLAGGAPARAADAKGQYALWGIGTFPCKTFLDDFQKNKEFGNALGSWLMGYITAANRLTPDTYDLTPIGDTNALVGLIYQFCQNHGDQTVESVVSDLVRTLATARLTAMSTVVEAKSNGKSMAIRTDTLVQIQKKLVQLGIYKAKPDGTFTPRMETALKDYQKSQKLPETGLPDPATIWRLLIQAPAAAKSNG